MPVEIGDTRENSKFLEIGEKNLRCSEPLLSFLKNQLTMTVVIERFQLYIEISLRTKVKLTVWILRPTLVIKDDRIDFLIEPRQILPLFDLY